MPLTLNYGKANHCIACGAMIAEDRWVCKLCSEGDPELVRIKEELLFRWLLNKRIKRIIKR